MCFPFTASAKQNITLGPPSSQATLKTTTTLSLPSAAQSRKLANKKSETRTPIHPGYSLFDWTKFSQSGQDLAGVGGRLLKVTESELAKHNTELDAWTAVRGKLFHVNRSCGDWLSYR